MKTRTWGLATLLTIGVAGCGSEGERTGCTSNGQQLKAQVLAQRDEDVAAGLFSSATVNPCNFRPADLERVRATRPERIEEYASACQKIADNGCSITDAEAGQ
jgi:hypothetical protein